MPHTPRLAPLLVVVALLPLGCSSTPDGNTSNPQSELMGDVTGLLRDYTAEHNKPPAKLADLAKYETLYSRGFQAVKAGTVLVVWGVPMPLTGGGTGVIAYEKKVEAEGGTVLLENGEVKQMTAAEFQAAPKATKK